MSFNIKTVKGINLTSKRVLLRVDYNIPDIKSDFRIKQSVATVEYILSQKPKNLLIISHLGRPKGRDTKFSLRPAAARLSELLSRRVWFSHDCIGNGVKEMSAHIKDGDILMLENLRFYAEEERNDNDFAKSLIEATGAEVFVQDGFGVVHRAHASTDAIAKLLPSVSGLLLQKEVEGINKVMKDPAHPLVAVIGGAKISDKLEVMNRLVDLADCVAVGGAMANNFLKITGHSIGKSLYDNADLELARDVMGKAAAKTKKQPFSFLLPSDVVISKSIDGKAPTRVAGLTAHNLADIESYPKIPKPASYSVGKDEAIFDIGPVSAARLAGMIGFAKTVIWNGTLGVAEAKGIAGAHPPFAHGTQVVAEAMIGPHNQHPSRPYSFVGGGDTVGYLETAGLVDDFDHVSTGGGAALELMSGKKLPGIESLMVK